MKTNSLSQFAAKNLPAGKHADGQGLWLVKSEKARGKWVLRVVVGGKRREMGLGRWPDVSISEARDKAGEARKLARGDSCPIEARRKSKRIARRLTVEEAVESCFEARKAQLKRDGQAGRWMSPLRSLVLPKLGNRAIEEIDQHALTELFEPVWHSKTDTSRKALNRLNLTLQHSAALGLSVDLQACMKARALLGKQRHEEKHIPSLPYADVPAFYKWLCAKETVGARALRFLLLTLARTSEVRSAVQGEIEGDIWKLPGDRTKTGVARRIPLVPEACRVADTCHGEFLFPGPSGTAISDATMSKMMRDEGYEARPHGFRATFRTWAEECTDADYATKESCLGHVVDRGVVGAYQRSDRFEKRRVLMTAWEQFLLGKSVPLEERERLRARKSTVQRRSDVRSKVF